jgi:putative membrane protein
MTEHLDYRFSLANERTYLAWVRTAIALVVAGLVAVKAIDFQHEVVRWVVGAPLLGAGALLSAGAPRRWHATERRMAEGAGLPTPPAWLGYGLAAYAVVVLALLIFD